MSGQIKAEDIPQKPNMHSHLWTPAIEALDNYMRKSFSSISSGTFVKTTLTVLRQQIRPCFHENHTEDFHRLGAEAIQGTEYILRSCRLSIFL